MDDNNPQPALALTEFLTQGPEVEAPEVLRTACLTAGAALGVQALCKGVTAELRAAMLYYFDEGADPLARDLVLRQSVDRMVEMIPRIQGVATDMHQFADGTVNDENYRAFLGELISHDMHIQKSVTKFMDEMIAEAEEIVAKADKQTDKQAH